MTQDLQAYPNLDPDMSYVAMTLHSTDLQAYCHQRITEHLHRRMMELLLPQDAQLLLFEITSNLLQRYEDYIRGGDQLCSEYTDTDGEILQKLEDTIMNMSHRMLPVMFVPMDLEGRFMVIMVNY